MATEQANITKMIVQIADEAARAAVRAMAMASAQNNQRAQNVGHKLGSPLMRQPALNWSSTGKYAELRNFRMEVWTCFKTVISHAERVLNIKYWLGRQGLPILETLTQAEWEMCNEEEGQFETLSKKFKMQYNETIKLLQFHKLFRQHNENAEEWIGRLIISVTECNYNNIDRQLKEQFIHGLNHNCMMVEIFRDLTTCEKRCYK